MNVAATPVHSSLPPPQAHPRTLPTGSGIVWRSWGQGAPVLLLHDWQGGWSDWRGNIAHLAASFEVHVADLPLPADAPQDTLAWAEALRQDLLFICPDQRWRLVGQGWGGSVAGMLAPAMPQLCGLVLLWAGAHRGAPCCAAGLDTHLLRHWQALQLPMLMIWGETEDRPFPVQTALALAAAHDEREWMVLPVAGHPMQQEHAGAINAVLAHWLLSRG